MSDKIIKIVIDGDASGGKKAVDTIMLSGEQLKEMFEEFGAGLREGVIKELEETGKKGEEAGKKTKDSFQNLLVTLGAAKLAFDGILGVVNTIVGAFVKLFNANAELADQIDHVMELTGVSAEMASTIIRAAGEAGVSADEMAQAFVANARIVNAAEEEMEKRAADVTAARDEEAKKVEALLTEHNAKIAEINKAAGERYQSLVDDKARVDEKYNRDNLDRDTKFADAKIEQTRKTNEAISELDEAHADALNSIQESIKQSEDDYQHARENAYRDYTEALDAADQKHADTLKDINADIARADADLVTTRKDLADDLAERLADAEKKHVATVNEINADITRLDAALAKDRQSLAEDLAEALTDAEKKHQQDLATIAASVAKEDADYARQRETTQTDLLDKLNQAEEAHADRQADLARQVQRVRDDLAQAEADRQDDYARKLVSISESASQKLEDIAQRRTDRIEQLNQSALEATEDFEQRKADRAEQTAQKLEDFDTRTQAGRNAAQQRLLTSTSELERQGLQSELDLYDQRQATARAKLEQEAAEAEAKEQEKQDKKLAKIQAQIDRENALYLQQQAEIEAAKAKAETDEADRLARANARAQAAGEQRLADLQLRITQENAAYEEQTARIQAQGDARAAEDLRRHTEALAALASRVAAENAAYTDQTARLQQQNADRLADLVARHDDALAKLQARIAAEDAAYADQTARLRVRNADELLAAQAKHDEALIALNLRISKEDERYAEQTGVLKREYGEREADAQRSHDIQLAAFVKRIDDENQQYQEQTQKLVTENRRRLAEFQKDYDTDLANAKYAYNLKVTDNAAAQKMLGDDTLARINKEDQAYKDSLASVKAKLDEFVDAAGKNLPPVVKLVHDMGYEWDDWMKKSPDERLLNLVDGFNKLPDGANKSALEMTAFGRSGTALNDFLSKYAEHTLPEWIDITAKANGMMSKEGVDAAKKSQEAWNAFLLDVQGFVLYASKELAPAFTELLGQLQAFIKDHGDEIIDFIRVELIPAIKDLLGFIGDVITAADTFAKSDIGKRILSGEISANVLANGSNGQPAAALVPVGLTPAANSAINQNGLDVRNRIIAEGGTNVADFIRILLGFPPVGDGSQPNQGPAPSQVIGGGTPISPPGGTPIGGNSAGGTTIINVQNPITGVEDIPNMMSHLNALQGSPY